MNISRAALALQWPGDTQKEVQYALNLCVFRNIPKNKIAAEVEKRLAKVCAKV
jgi:hypothetical protein